MPLYLGGSINRFTIRFLLRGLLKADKKVFKMFAHLEKSLYICTAFERKRNRNLEFWKFG